MKVAVTNKRENLEEQLKGLREIIDGILEPLKGYDQFIDETDQKFIANGSNITTQELCDILMSLSMELYYLNTFVENLSFSVDIAKAKKNDEYTSRFIELSDYKSSIAQKQAFVENLIIADELTFLCYQNAYKIAKGKLEKGYEIVNSIKKILNIREQELQLTNVTQGRKYE